MSIAEVKNSKNFIKQSLQYQKCGTTYLILPINDDNVYLISIGEYPK